MKLQQFNILKLLFISALVWILQCYSNTTTAQTVESLSQTIAKQKNDSIKTELYLQLSNAYLSQNNSEQAISAALQANAIAQKINNKILVANCNFFIADVYNQISNTDSALYFYNKTIDVVNTLNDIAFLADTYSEMAIIYKNKDLLDSSLQLNIKALELRQKGNLQAGTAISYNNIALIYRKKNDWDNSIANYLKGSNIFNDLHDDKNLCVVYRNIGMLYKNKKQYDSVFLYFNKAQPLATKLNDTNSLNIIQLNTALCYNDLKQYNKALPILQNLYNKNSFNNDEEYPFLIYGLGVCHVGLNNINEGLIFLKKAISLNYKKSRLEYKGLVNLALSNAYGFMGNYKNAYDYYKTFRLYQDSLYTENNIKNVNELTTKYKTKEKEQEIVLLNKENELKDLSIKEKKRTLVFSLIGLILSIIAATAAILLYRGKRKFSNQLEEKNKIISTALQEKEVLLKEIHHRVKNNLQVISSLLNLQSKTITDETALMALNEGKNRVKSMALIHQNLYRDDNLTGVDIKDYIEKLINSLFTSYNIETNKITLITQIENLQLDVDTVIPLGLILNELITNALKYAFINKSDGKLLISLQQYNNALQLIVQDNGVGMDNDNLNKNNPSSIGYKLIQSFIQKLSATMNVEKNNGTIITLIINKYKLV